MPASNSSDATPHRETVNARDALLVACLAVLLYLPALGFQLVWDDPMLLELTRARIQAGGIGSLLSSEFLLGSQSPHTGYFRPVVLVSLAADGSIGNGRPWAYHLTNILLHATACALVVLLLRRLLPDRLSSLFGGLLFAAHPVHVEAVAFVSGRTDLWAAVFVLLGTLFWARAATIASAACVALGALSKEVALMAIPAWLAWDALKVASPSPNAVSWVKRNGAWMAGACAAIAVVFALRLGVAGVSLGGVSAPEAIPGIAEPTAIRLLVPRLATYFRLLAIPWPLSAFYSAADLRLEPGVIAGACAALAVFVLAWITGAKRVAAAGLSWTLVFLAPALGLVTFSSGAAYSPSAGVRLSRRRARCSFSSARPPSSVRGCGEPSSAFTPTWRRPLHRRSSLISTWETSWPRRDASKKRKPRSLAPSRSHRAAPMDGTTWEASGFDWGRTPSPRPRTPTPFA